VDSHTTPVWGIWLMKPSSSVAEAGREGAKPAGQSTLRRESGARPGCYQGSAEQVNDWHCSGVWRIPAAQNTSGH
jgi:hypothetical protein